MKTALKKSKLISKPRRKTWRQWLIIIVLSCMFFSSIWDATASTTDSHPLKFSNPISQEDVKASALKVADVLEKEYIYPDKAKAYAHAINKRLILGQYRNIKTLGQFISTFENDLYELSKDQHLGIYLREKDNALTHVLPPANDKQANNFAIQRVEVLPGNIGYIKINKFYADSEAIPVIDTALSFLSRSEAVIVDLRECIGGSINLVHHILNYFYDEPIPLWHIQDNASNGGMTRATPHSHAFGSETPLYVLTSKDTASAAELFAYTLKHTNRAQIVGQITTGAAHAVSAQPINDYFYFRMPAARMVNPVTQTDWEQVGVVPTIKSSEKSALNVAQVHAIGVLAE